MVKIRKEFGSLDELRNSNSVAEGDVCSTCGYYTAGDGGAAKYRIICAGKDEYSDNGGDTVKITGASISDTTKALFGVMLHTGDDVNILQFGAKNIKAKSSDAPNDLRDDSPAIQHAIEYVKSRIGKKDNEFQLPSTVVKIPAGTYYLKTQIKMPPYLQMYLMGNVQFISYVDEGDVQLYTLKDSSFIPVGKKDDAYYRKELFEKLPDSLFEETSSDATDTSTAATETSTSGTDASVAETEVPTAEENPSSTATDNATSDSKASMHRFAVFRKGAIKICYDRNADNMIIDPFKDNTVLPGCIKSQCFGGPGSLTLFNKIKNKAVYGAEASSSVSVLDADEEKFLPPAYACGIEVGSLEDRLLFDKEKRENKSNPQPKYYYLNFDKVKICNYNVGLLAHPFFYYSNVFENMEFSQNRIGYCVGTYSLDESGLKLNGADACIVGEGGHETGEMLHFRDSLFTGNYVDCRFLVSGTTHTFTECHFDFDNCIFHAPFRSSIFVKNCHIEGVGRKLFDKYDSGKYLKLQRVSSFNERSSEYPWNEYYGILYAKPLVKFTGTSAPRDYVNLSITDSTICDYYYASVPMFVFENNSGGEKNWGHPNSCIILKNNSLHNGANQPIAHTCSVRNSAVYSGFMLPDYISSEGNIAQNVSIVSEGNREWVGFPKDGHVHNYRFLSYRTLANKYPLFQNISYSKEKGWSGVEVSGDKNVGLNSNGGYPLIEYNNASKNTGMCAKAFTYKCDVYNTDVEYSGSTNKHIRLKFENGVRCGENDAFRIACVAGTIPVNVKRISLNNESEIGYELENLSYKLSVTEYDINGNNLGVYDYELPFNHKIDGIPTNVVKAEKFVYYTNPCSAAAKHCVKNSDAVRLGFALDIPVPKSNISNGWRSTQSLCGLFCENDRTVWNSTLPV